MPKLFIATRTPFSPKPTAEAGLIVAKSLDFFKDSTANLAKTLIEVGENVNRFKDAEARQEAGADIARVQLEIQAAMQKARAETQNADEFEKQFGDSVDAIIKAAREGMNPRVKKFVGERFELIDQASTIRLNSVSRGLRIDSARAHIVTQEAIFLQLAKEAVSPSERLALEIEYFEMLDGAVTDGVYNALEIARLKVSFTRDSTANSEAKIFQDEVSFHVTRLIDSGLSFSDQINQTLHATGDLEGVGADERKAIRDELDSLHLTITRNSRIMDRETSAVFFGEITANPEIYTPGLLKLNEKFQALPTTDKNAIREHLRKSNTGETDRPTDPVVYAKYTTLAKDDPQAFVKANFMEDFEFLSNDSIDNIRKLQVHFDQRNTGGDHARVMVEGTALAISFAKQEGVDSTQIPLFQGRYELEYVRQSKLREATDQKPLGREDEQRIADDLLRDMSTPTWFPWFSSSLGDNFRLDPEKVQDAVDNADPDSWPQGWKDQAVTWLTQDFDFVDSDGERRKHVGSHTLKTVAEATDDQLRRALLDSAASGLEGANIFRRAPLGN